MINSFVIVGRINNIKIDKDSTTLVIAVKRPYKNCSGVYEDDLLEVRPFKMPDSIDAFLNIDDVVGVKGRIQSGNVLLAEKVTVVKKSE